MADETRTAADSMTEKAERIEGQINEIRETLGILESSLPRQVDGYALSQKSKLPWKVLLYREALIWRIVELGRSALESFLDHRLVSGVVLTRAAVEASAACGISLLKLMRLSILK